MTPRLMGPRLRGEDDSVLRKLSRNHDHPRTPGTLSIGASELEYRMIGPAPDDAPTIVHAA